MSMTAAWTVDSFDIVVFGASGDLARRKLLPALYFRDCDGQLQPDVRIIGGAKPAKSFATSPARHWRISSPTRPCSSGSVTGSIMCRWMSAPRPAGPTSPRC